MLLVAAVLAACGPAGEDADGDGSPSPSPGALEHPTGPEELVVRVTVGGGFVPMEFNLTELPAFSLYGDGTVVVPGPQIAIFPGPALPNLLERHVTEQGIQRILQAARAAGLQGPERNLRVDRVADAPTTTFTVVAEGEVHTTSAYALGIDAGPGGEGDDQDEIRRQLRVFQEDLTGLAEWMPGEVSEEQPYEYERLRLFVRPGRPAAEEELEQAEVQWPLDVSLAAFGEPHGQTGYRCGVVEGDRLEQLLPQAEQANQLTPWVSDEEVYSLLFRPLLPDEAGCPANAEP